MIKIYLSDKAYDNDIAHIVKMFYYGVNLEIIEENDFNAISSLLSSNDLSHPIIRNGLDDLDNSLILSLYVALEPDKTSITALLSDGESLSREEDVGYASDPNLHYKNFIKRLLYDVLSRATGKTLPWGILTGIRPTKLVFQMIEEGKSQRDIYSYMRDEYLCSEDKIATSIDIASRELKLLHDIDYKNGYSLYIGIPFCPSTCLYCSFTSYSIEKFANYVDDYLKALEKEIIFAATIYPNKKLTCVYLGGGTPTTLTAGQLDWLLALVIDNFDFTYVKEFCVEAGRPDSITRDKLLVLKKWGVNRISINPQSMQQKTLDIIGRRHTVDAIKEAFYLARETGHDNINMDIIIGLPGENIDDVEDTLKQIRELNPDSLTVHTLALKRAARLNIERENYIDLKPRDVNMMYKLTSSFAKENDYLPYYLYRQKNMADNLENVGYARYNKEGIYNILIMEEQQTILALGAGGLSKYVSHNPHYIAREDNGKSVLDYIGRINQLIEKKRKFFEENKA